MPSARSTARRRREVQEAQRTAASSYDLEHEVWDLALEDQVSKALDELPGEERRAIELAYFKGYTYVEVAQSLGQPEGTVKSRIRNGMQRMRVALDRSRDPGGRRVITHDQANDLLAAYALDAVREHRARPDRIAPQRVPSLRDGARGSARRCVGSWELRRAGAGAACGRPSRAGSTCLSTRSRPPPLLKVLPRTGMTEKAARSPAKTPRSRTGRRYLMVVTSVAAAAAAAAAVLGFSLVRTSDQNDRLQAQIGSNSSSVVAALETPGHTLVSLHAPNHAELAQFVLLPSGRGYLVSSALPKLTADRTYQLWGIIGGQAISLGLLGPAPSQAAFTVAGSGDPESTGCDGRAGGWVSPPHHNDACVESHLGWTAESPQQRRAVWAFSSGLEDLV